MLYLLQIQPQLPKMEPNHAAIPHSPLATKYSCGRSPVTQLQWALSICRFSVLSRLPGRWGTIYPARFLVPKGSKLNPGLIRIVIVVA